MNNVFHIFAIVFAIIIALLISWFSNWGTYFATALIFVVSSNWLIAFVTEWAHKKAATKEYENRETQLGHIRIYFKNAIGLLEIIFYTFLFLFHQVVFIAGWLVIKALWRYDGNRDDKDNKSFSSEESAAAAIFRIGVIFSLLSALMAALLISFSGFKSSGIFKIIEGVLT